MNKLLVFMTDFGLDDGAISAMEGVAFSVDINLNIRHLTHNIPQYNIFDASYRLHQAINYWPEGTVFVSVVDPGVGSSRKSVVARTVTNQYIVTPDNGTLTHISRFIGIDEVREIEETTNRLKNSELSYTFHGRDVYAYTGARLASGVISFEEVGTVMNKDDIVVFDLFGCHRIENGVLGQIDILDVRFGSLWTSIPYEDFKACGFTLADNVRVEIFHNGVKVYSSLINYGKSFADVEIGEPVIYMNSAYHMAVAINQESFAEVYHIGVGKDWKITMTKE
ncbi:MAG: DNA-directed RNA polymerase subunit delta [Erysipelotrichaceae bacterium]|jgi:S-adenosylmethionine hydrolase|nr:DNA-directed RNA polymerase subunit delta [Erysipelotrichaceae bacterium]MBQ1757603.1 S-adenosyl-l-methionine hydroxide adenosyltransferase family protein [Erysipelotrichaceae bacterium]MBQ2684914.1 S-adenosyl-l-methionine hydroxide adenosyltransferase family protein [Erysipelotrichaceae bacterium]